MGDFVVTGESGPAAQRTRNVNVLVTGFGPFRNTTRNPSWETAKLLAKQGIEKKVDIDIAYIPVEYAKVISAISYFYGQSDERLVLPREMVDDEDIAARDDFDPQKRYDLVIHIGQGRSGGMHIETVAHQLGYRLLDAVDTLAPIIDGTDEATDLDFHIPEQLMNNDEKSAGLNRGYPISADVKAQFGSELQLQTAIDTNSLAETLGRMYPQFKINKSTNAGRYLCEFIYFGSLAGSIIQQRRLQQKTKGHEQSVQVLFVHVPPENDPLAIQDMVKVMQSIIRELVVEIPINS